MQMGPNTRDLEGLQAQQATRLADFGVPLDDEGALQESDGLAL